MGKISLDTQIERKTYAILDNVMTTKAQVGPNKFVTSSFERDANENIVKTIEPEGNFHTTKYDERNLPYQQIQGADNPAEQQVTNFAYNENAGLTKVTYGDGITTKGAISNFYDNFDRLQKTMDETGNYTEFIRDTAGLLRETKRVDSTGKVLLHDKVDYDESGRPFQTQHLVDDPVTMTSDWTVSLTYYDKSGRTDKTVDAKGREFHYKWDGLGRLVETLDTLGNKTATEYDENSNPVTMTSVEVDPQTGAQETFTSQNIYDPLDRLYQTIDNVGNISEVKYDGRDNVIWAKDREGNTTTRKYDGLSRLTDTMYQMRQGGTGAGIIEKEITISNVFDNNSRLVQKKDGRGNISSYAYDSVNRMKTETLPDGTQKGYFFRPEGVLHHSVDANGTQVTYGYDNALRMIHKDIQRGVGVEGVTSEDYWYDGANRMTYAQNDNSTITRKYNSYSEVYEETQAVTIDGQTQTKTVQSEFDRIGNRTALIYPSGKKLNYTRDELDRTKMISETVGANNVRPVAQYAYNGYRMKQRKSGNGTQLDIAYDAMRRITQYQNNFVGTGQGPVLGIAGFDYGYNKEGMRTYENYMPGTSEVNQQSRAKVFTYDSLYQITGVKYDVPNPITEINSPGTQPYSKQVSYAFDNSGNRNAVETTRWGVSSTSQSYQSNTLNQYTTIDSSVFGYDNVGNMTTGIIYLDDLTNPGEKIPTQARFIYDYQNNLVRAEQTLDNRVLGTHVYDVLGRRAYKNAYDRESTAYQATYFWYNGVECIEETDSIGQTIATYTFGIGIDEAICIEYPTTSEQYPQAGTYWYHTDVLGSVIALTDSDGAVIERYKYDIYGEATVLEPDGQTVRIESMLGNRILYTGREYDKETGLYYYRARYYHAQMGRFISTDPIGADVLGNLCAYVNNTPVNRIDPYGLDVRMSAEQFDQIKGNLPTPLLEALDITGTDTTVTAYDLYNVVISENVTVGAKAGDNNMAVLQLYLYLLQRVGDETRNEKVAALKQFLLAVMAEEVSQFGFLDLSQKGMPGSEDVANEAQEIFKRDLQSASQPIMKSSSPIYSPVRVEFPVVEVIAAGAYSAGNTVLPLDEAIETYECYKQENYGYMVLYGSATLVQIIPLSKLVGKAGKWLWKGGKWATEGIGLVKKAEKVLPLVKPAWVKDAGTFVNWITNLDKEMRAGKRLVKEEIDDIVKQAKKYGVDVRPDPPHPKFQFPHLNIGKEGQAHIIVPPGYKLP